MSESIFKEVTFTPQVFDKHNIYPDSKKLEDAMKSNDLQKLTKLIDESSKTFEKLLVVLRNLSTSGILINAFSDWFEKFEKYINEYDQDKQDRLRSMMIFLESRGRIVSAQKSKSSQNDEEFWIAEASRLNSIREFDFIVASKNSSHTLQINNIDNNFLIYEGAKVRPQTEEFMQSMLSPILGYAEIVKVIDPYFHLDSKDRRFENALDIICNILGNHHGIFEPSIIEIHTSIKPLTDNKEFLWEKTEKWPKLIKQYEEKCKHTITIHIWEEIKRENEWHDRWIIVPNQCGITLGSGSDIKKWTDATWGMMGYDDIGMISSKFDAKRNVYTYIGNVTSTDAIKKNRPRHTYSKMSTEEKLAWENEQRRKEEDRLAPRERINTPSGMKIQKRHK